MKDVAEQAQQPLDCWQGDAAQVICMADDGGYWVALETGTVVGRQNGKGTILEARTTTGSLLSDRPTLHGRHNPFYGERLTMWTAHEMKTAREAFLRLEAFLDGHSDFRKQIRSVDRGRGYECIYFRNGSRIRFIARTSGSGRGFTGDLIIFDEAYALLDEHISALMPTLSARRNPQIIYTSTPPLDSYSGEVLFRLRDRALGVEGLMLPKIGVALDEWSLSWVEWSNAGSLDDVGMLNPETGLPKIDLMDRQLWRNSNPAILSGRIRESFIKGELDSMEARDFAREVLVVWPPKPIPTENPITPIDWRQLLDTDSTLDLSTGVVFAVDITPRRDHASIVAYGVRPDGIGHGELIEHRAGTDWIVTRLLELKYRHNPLVIVIDGAGPSGAHVEDIEKGEQLFIVDIQNGLTRTVRIKQPDDRTSPERGDLIVMNASDMGRACGMFETGVRGRMFRQLGETRVDVALGGAAIRNIGDGAWGWARRQSTVDISPLVAFTEARWGYETFAHLVNVEYDPLKNIEPGSDVEQTEDTVDYEGTLVTDNYSGRRFLTRGG